MEGPCHSGDRHGRLVQVSLRARILGHTPYVLLYVASVLLPSSGLAEVSIDLSLVVSHAPPTSGKGEPSHTSPEGALFAPKFMDCQSCRRVEFVSPSGFR